MIDKLLDQIAQEHQINDGVQEISMRKYAERIVKEGFSMQEYDKRVYNHSVFGKKLEQFGFSEKQALLISKALQRTEAAFHTARYILNLYIVEREANISGGSTEKILAMWGEKILYSEEDETLDSFIESLKNEFLLSKDTEILLEPSAKSYIQAGESSLKKLLI